LISQVEAWDKAFSVDQLRTLVSSFRFINSSTDYVVDIWYAAQCSETSLQDQIGDIVIYRCGHALFAALKDILLENGFTHIQPFHWMKTVTKKIKY